MKKHYPIPKKAHILWTLLCPGGGGLGVIPLSWVLPLLLVSVTDQFGRVADLKTEMWGLVCLLPFGLEVGAVNYYLAVAVDAFLFLFVGGRTGFLLGRRLWIHLVVTKFGWLTLEEVDKFEEGHADL